MVKKAKIIFLGDTAVGKSCIISAINGHSISLNHEPTIGMDYSTKLYQTPRNQEYKLQLWDTAGQEKFRSIMPSYIRNSKIAILVFDLTSSKTFKNLDKWIQMYEQSSSPDSKLILVGNKTDLIELRSVNMEKIQQKINKYELKYIQTSAKTREGIYELMAQMIKQLQQMRIPDENVHKNEERTQLSSRKMINQSCCGRS